MTTPKPASAPQADSLQQIVTEMRASDSAGFIRIGAWADRIESVLAASAQVREGEPTINSQQIDSKLIVEPVPVAQGIDQIHADEFRLLMYLEEDGHPHNGDAVNCVRALVAAAVKAEATIADHASRVASMQAQSDRFCDKYLAALKRAELAEALLTIAAQDKRRVDRSLETAEASLAACRADADAAWIAAIIDEAHQQTDAGLCIGYRAADRVKRRAREIIAAIDALLEPRNDH